MPDIATLEISASIVKNEKRLCFVKKLFIVLNYKKNGCYMLDARFLILDSGCWIVD